MWKKVLVPTVALVAIGSGVTLYSAIFASASDDRVTQLAISACQQQLRIPARLKPAGKYKGMVVKDDTSSPMHAEVVDERNMSWWAKEQPLDENDKLSGIRWHGTVALWIGSHQRLMSDGHWQTINGPETQYAGCYVKLFVGEGSGLQKLVDGGSRILAGVSMFDLNFMSFR